MLILSATPGQKENSMYGIFISYIQISLLCSQMFMNIWDVRSCFLEQETLFLRFSQISCDI